MVLITVTSWTTVTLSILMLLGCRVTCNITCIRRACNDEESSIVCSQSLILISDVTNWRLERDHVAFENLKRACMGKGSCDPSRVCSSNDKQTLVVHYFCVDAANIRSKSCNRHMERVDGDSGYIQSPGYPGATDSYERCGWRIEPPNGSVVVLSLHDIATSGNKEDCDGGLVVSGRSCDGEGHVFAPRLLCGGENLHSLMRCGQVDIELAPSHRVYPLRFWLSFHVHSRNQPSNFQASLLPCSGWIYSMDAGSGHKGPGVDVIETTPAAAAVDIIETNTQLLIIMLSIISGISAVLLVILIVVCIRCRLLQSPNSEPMYSVPSPGLQAHYEYISSLESEKPRPQLVDGYFEVADALPFVQRGETPNSPAYAEVEQFAQLRKGPCLSPSEEDLMGSKPPSGETKQNESDVKIMIDKFSGKEESARPKRGMLGRLKGEKLNKQSERDKRSSENRDSFGPKIIPVPPAKKDTCLKNTVSSSVSTLGSQNPDYEDVSATYEPIEEFSPFKSVSKQNKIPDLPANHPVPRKQTTDTLPKSTHQSCAEPQSKTLDRPKNNQHGNAQSPVSATNKDPPTPTTRKIRPKPSFKSNTCGLVEGSKTLPSKVSRGYLQNSGVKNNNYKRPGYKDVPKASGIVKNGIQLFEQNGSVA